MGDIEPDTSSEDASHCGPLEVGGLLARGLNMARRSGEPGPLPSRLIAGAMTGDDVDPSLCANCAYCGEAIPAAWRRREGARCRGGGNLGEGRATDCRVGLSEGAGL